MKKLPKKERYLSLAMVLLLGVALGYALSNFSRSPSTVRVWAVDETVQIPAGLQKYLETEATDDCKGYRGTGSPTGVALFAVRRTHNNNYAQMTYGCSDNLFPETTIVAVKQSGKWQLIPPTEYYEGSAPKCEVLKKYNISREAESECVSEEDIQKNRKMQEGI